MRVLLINTSYGLGGAGQIVLNLHSELQRMGVDSRVLAASSEVSSNDQVYVLPHKRGLLERFTRRVSREIGLSNNGILRTFALRRDPNLRWSTVLNLHNLHGGYFDFLALPYLTRHKPAVLTLHDMWAFTGHCVYSFDCERWKTGCGHCPYPDSYEPVQRDGTRIEHRLKRWSFLNSGLHIVAISRWMYDLARESMLGSLPLHHIPNGIDLQAFKPLSRSAARQSLQLPTNKKIILYVAHRLADPRKGFDLLVKALARLPDKLREECLLLVMGEAEAGLQAQVPMQAVFLGFVTDDRRKAEVFASADVFAFPTRADNLPIVLQESLACGRPMVSFAVGGVPDLVRDGVTGFLAPPEDVNCFAASLRRLLENGALREEMGSRCRSVAEKEFSLELQAQRYVALFETVVNAHNCADQYATVAASNRRDPKLP
jgi:glycosyltransferase involved in cell wall biosynthesis